MFDAGKITNKEDHCDMNRLKTFGKALGFFGIAAIAASLTGVVHAAGQATQPTICSRSCWGSRSTSTPTEMSSLNRAIIHHTAGSGDYNVSTLSQSQAKVRAVQNLHIDTNGWSDIGYHFLFDKLGNSFEGRRNSLNKAKRPRGAHDGTNTNSFGFSNLGYYHPPYNHTITAAQKSMLYDVIAWRMPDGWSPYGAGTYNGKTVGFVDGHRDVKATACPGDGIYNTIIGTNHNAGEARDEINARIQGSGGSATIIDNNDSGFSTTGSWATSSGSGFYGTNSLWASTGGASATATWSATLAPGNYDVYAWWVSGSNRASNAPYQVNHLNGSSTVTANQTSNGGQWNLLGSYAFDGSSSVVLSDSANNSVVSADAVRFVFTSGLEYIADNADSGYSASSNWITSSSTAGYYGSNYDYRLTASTSDAASWSLNLPATGSYQVFARWTAGSNRATSAPYIVSHAGGNTTVTQNQQQNNGTWVSLGTYTFNSGTSTRVMLSCWTSSGTVVIADAIKLVPQ